MQENVDPPLTYMTEHLQDWSYCKPSLRQTAVHQRDIGDDRVCIENPGDPICWIFSKINPYPPSPHLGDVNKSTTAKSKIHSAVSEGLENISITQRLTQERKDSLSGVLYLVEVHFMLSLVTGDPTIVPMKRHMFGELSRTLQGCKILKEESVISSLLAEAKLASPLSHSPRSSDSGGIPQSTSCESLVLFDDVVDELNISKSQTSEVDIVNRVKAAVWALGHIGATDSGFELLQETDPSFIPWCIDMAMNSETFSVRSVCFSALGLLSRCDKSRELFSQAGWGCSVNYSYAVAIPNDLSSLQRPVKATETPTTVNTVRNFEVNSSPGKLRASRAYFYTLIAGVSDLRLRELYCDVLECIAKLPGHILSRETKNKLSKIKSAHPEIFSQRALYLATHHVLLLFSFTLSIRRYVFGCFHPDARLQDDF